jgi:hypothetical protein
MERIRVQAQLMYFLSFLFQELLLMNVPSWHESWQKGFTTNWKFLAIAMSLPHINRKGAILQYVAQVNMKPFPRKLQTHRESQTSDRLNLQSVQPDVERPMSEHVTSLLRSTTI